MRTLRNGILLGTALAVTGLLAATAGASTPAGDAQANRPQVAGDTSSDTTARFPTNKQNEPTIAFNPQDHRILIAGPTTSRTSRRAGPVRSVVRTRRPTTARSSPASARTGSTRRPTVGPAGRTAG